MGLVSRMKLWLLIIGTILVYITVSNDAKRLNGDMMEGKEQQGMVRVKRAVGGRKEIQRRGKMGKRGGLRTHNRQNNKRKNNKRRVKGAKKQKKKKKKKKK